MEPHAPRGPPSHPTRATGRPMNELLAYYRGHYGGGHARPGRGRTDLPRHHRGLACVGFLAAMIDDPAIWQGPPKPWNGSAPTLITLFTDAGFCPKTHVASWAAWAKANGQTYRQSGVMNGKIDTSDIAELRAIANGVAMVMRHMKPTRGAKIIAQTDCAAAMQAILGTGYKTPRAQRRVKSAVDYINNRLTAAGVSIEMRHVSGHKGTATPRNAVNTSADMECRRQLAIARNGQR